MIIEILDRYGHLVDLIVDPTLDANTMLLSSPQFIVTAYPFPKVES